MIGNEDGLSVYELHIAVKDHCFGFGREDRLVGVTVMQLKDIENQVSTESGFRIIKITQFRYKASVGSKTIKPSTKSWEKNEMSLKYS